MDQVETEQEVLSALQNFVKARLGGDVERLTSASLETARPDVRVDLAGMCSRMSLALLRETNNLEPLPSRLFANFTTDSVRLQRLLAWSRLTLDLCQPQDEAPNDEAETARKRSEQIGLYCSSMAMFGLGHLVCAQQEFEKLKGSVAGIGLCECLLERYTIEAMAADEKTTEVLEELFESGRLRSHLRKSYEDDDKGEKLFTPSGKGGLKVLKEKGVKSPSQLICQVSPEKAKECGSSIEVFEPEKKNSKAGKNHAKALMILGRPPVGPWGCLTGQEENMLFQSLAGLFCCGTDIHVVSWNVQLMNTCDGKDEEMEDAIKAKAKSAAKVVAQPGDQGTGRVGASLVVIQEAPGPQLREGKAGQILKGIAKDYLFTKELRQQPFFRNSNFEFREVALSNMVDNEEKGEDHIFGWNQNILKLVDGPDALEAPDNAEWQARAPSWAAFKVGTTETTLIVVSVHAKSGGNTETQKDIKMIGEAVNKLWDKWDSKREQDKDLIVLMVGDFNYSSSKVFPDKLLDSDLYCLAEQFRTDIKTNIWMFNRTGKEQDGKSYDYGFVRSVVQGKAGAVKAKINVPLIARKEFEEVQNEMEQLGQQMRPFFKSCFESDLDSEETEDEPRAKSIRRKVAKSTMEKFTGNMPTWMREDFKHFVKMTWSDHMPIAIGLSIPGSPQQSPSSTSQGPPRKPLPPIPRVNRKLTSDFTELAGAKGGERL